MKQYYVCVCVLCVWSNRKKSNIYMTAKHFRLLAYAETNKYTNASDIIIVEYGVAYAHDSRSPDIVKHHAITRQSCRFGTQSTRDEPERKKQKCVVLKKKTHIHRPTVFYRVNTLILHLILRWPENIPRIKINISVGFISDVCLFAIRSSTPISIRLPHSPQFAHFFPFDSF